MMIYRYDPNCRQLTFSYNNSGTILLLILLLQGTASVVLSGLVASLKLLGGTLGDHTFLFLGAGEVCYFTLANYC